MRGTDQNTGPQTPYEAWTEHPYFRYRGCAPDADDPRRAAGNPELTLDAWHGPDVDGGEAQPDRVRREHAAVEVCLSCPVMVQCDVYASSVRLDGKLAEPGGIRGGRTALERHRRFIKARHQVASVVEPAPVEQLKTAQKRAVLKALAAYADPVDVAFAAGMDLRTANWQVSRLRTQLGLPDTASRTELLEAAATRGLLEGVRIVPDGEPARPRVPSPPRARFAHVAGQLSLWESELAELAPVHDLFPNQPMEAAA